MLAVFCGGLACGLAWSASQSAVPPPERVVEPSRPARAPVAIVLVASDGSAVAEAIDRASGRGGYSHAFIDAGHPDSILDYRPGSGVHWAPRDTYDGRDQARVELEGRAGEQLFGCARSRLGQAFDAAGLLMGTSSIANCCGLVYGCLPLELRSELGGDGRPVSPNDLARLFGARRNETVTWSEDLP